MIQNESQREGSLESVKFGGPKLTAGRTIFELMLAL